MMDGLLILQAMLGVPLLANTIGAVANADVLSHLRTQCDLPQ